MCVAHIYWKNVSIVAHTQCNWKYQTNKKRKRRRKENHTLTHTTLFIVSVPMHIYSLSCAVFCDLKEKAPNKRGNFCSNSNFAFALYVRLFVCVFNKILLETLYVCYYCIVLSTNFITSFKVSFCTILRWFFSSLVCSKTKAKTTKKNETKWMEARQWRRNLSIISIYLHNSYRKRNRAEVNKKRERNLWLLHSSPLSPCVWSVFTQKAVDIESIQSCVRTDTKRNVVQGWIRWCPISAE